MTEKEMRVYCSKCREYVPASQLKAHPHNLGIEIISDDDPRARDSSIPPLHGRARWQKKKKD